jgi:hypothetical protein
LNGPGRSVPSERTPSLPAMSAGNSPGATREENAIAANALLEAELAHRNGRKDAQENTARGVIVTAGLVLTLLLGLANDAGLFSKTSIVARIALVVTVTFGAGAAGCSMAVLWPRKYERMGKKALDEVNTDAYLDQPRHKFEGKLMSTRIGIAKTMDDRHEEKACWLKWAFRLLAVAFAALLVQAVVLAIDPPPSKPSAQIRIVSSGAP